MQGCGGETPYCLVGVLMFFSNTVSSASRCYFKTQGAGRVDAHTGSAFSGLTIFKKAAIPGRKCLNWQIRLFTATHVFCEV